MSSLVALILTLPVMSLTPTQTKVITIIAFVILIPIELLFFAAMIAILLGEEDAKVQTAFSMIFTMAIFFLPLRWAYLTWRRLKQKSAPPQLPVAMAADAVIRIQTKIYLPEYRRLMYYISYSNSVFIYLHIIGLGMVFSSLLFEGKTVCMIEVISKAGQPVFLKQKNKPEEFYIRRFASTKALTGMESVNYIIAHWKS